MGMHEKIQETDRTWHVKLAIRAVTAIVAIVAIGLVARHAYDISGIYEQIRDYIAYSYGVFVEFDFEDLPRYVQFVYLALIPFGLTVFWFVLYTMFYALRKRPIHPGWTIAYDLLLVGGYITYTYFMFRFSRFLLRADDTYCTSETYRETINDIREYEASHPEVDFRIGSEDDYLDRCHLFTQSPMWTIGMMIALTVIHFFLAIWGMFDTSHRRHQVVGKRMADDMINEMEANRRRSSHGIEEESVI